MPNIAQPTAPRQTDQTAQSDDRIPLIVNISRRLFTALMTLFAVAAILIAISRLFPDFLISDALFVWVFGATGGFISIQRRLKHYTKDDLTLLNSSYVFTLLAPFVGGVLAILLYILFLSQLLSGALFPKFLPDMNPGRSESIFVVFDTHAEFGEYAKLLFWSFVAGFSETFVTDIVSQFERKGKGEVKDETPMEGSPSLTAAE